MSSALTPRRCPIRSPTTKQPPRLARASDQAAGSTIADISPRSAAGEDRTISVDMIARELGLRAFKVMITVRPRRLNSSACRKAHEREDEKHLQHLDHVIVAMIVVVEQDDGVEGKDGSRLVVRGLRSNRGFRHGPLMNSMPRRAGNARSAQWITALSEWGGRHRHRRCHRRPHDFRRSRRLVRPRPDGRVCSTGRPETSCSFRRFPNTSRRARTSWNSEVSTTYWGTAFRSRWIVFCAARMRSPVMGCVENSFETAPGCFFSSVSILSKKFTNSVGS